MRLAKGGKAWLPWEKIKPPTGSSEDEIREALKKSFRVRVTGYDAEDGVSVVTMWTADDEANWEETYTRERERIRQERELRRQQEKVNLRQNYNPNEWLDGVVVAVKKYGISVRVLYDLDVFVPVSNMPEILTIDDDETGAKTPDFRPREQIQIRIIGYNGTDERGRDKYRCSMMPIDSVAGGDAAAGGSKSSGKRTGKGTGKGSQSAEAFTTFFAGRALETESTQAAEEQFVMNTLKADELKKEFGPTDRRAYLAAKGFPVVDYATATQLQEACRPDPSKKKVDPKAKAEARPASNGKPLPVWINYAQKGKQIGHIITFPLMTDAEKERLALEVAMREANDGVQNGANVSKVEVSERAVFVRISTPGSFQF